MQCIIRMVFRLLEAGSTETCMILALYVKSVEQ